MKKILVPTDFSPNADKALDFAVQIAKQAKAEIILIHACEILNLTFNDHIDLKKEYNQTIIDKAMENLSLLKKSIEDTEQLTVKIYLFQGTVTDTILQVSEDQHADLVVMGTLGNAGLKEKIFGSKTAEIIGKTNVPVLVVGLLSEWDIPEKIALAVNEFEENPDATRFIFELAGLFKATVHVVIITDEDADQESDYLKRKKIIMDYVEKLKLRYKSTVIKHTCLYNHKFEEPIEEFITQQGMDILAMVTHKRTFLESIFNRSMTKKMSYHTQIPLLAIPAIKTNQLKHTENENNYSNTRI